MCLRSGHWLSSLEVFIRILTCLNIAVLVSSDGTNLTAELNKLESRLVSMTKKANTKNIDYFVLSNKLDDLQQKIGEYQDQDRRMIIQINGLPYITAAYLYKVIESLSGVRILVNQSIQSLNLRMMSYMDVQTQFNVQYNLWNKTPLHGILTMKILFILINLA